MREYALKLAPIHHSEKPRRYRDDRVLFVATGSEGIGRRIVDDIDTRLRKAGSDRKIFDDAMQFAKFLLVGRLCTSRADGDLIGKPIRPDIHDQSKPDGDIENE